MSPENLPQGLRPIVQEILLLTEFYDRVGEIVDHCSFSDYETYRALYTLQKKGILEFTEAPHFPTHPHPLLDSRAVESLRRRISGWARGGPDYLKIVFFFPTTQLLRELIRILSSTPYLLFDPECASLTSTGDVPLGPLGRVTLDGGPEVILLVLPVNPLYRPLWEASARGVYQGIIVVDPQVKREEVAEAERFIFTITGRQALTVSLSPPGDPKRPVMSGIFLREGDPQGVVSLLRQALEV